MTRSVTGWITWIGELVGGSRFVESILNIHPEGRAVQDPTHRARRRRRIIAGERVRSRATAARNMCNRPGYRAAWIPDVLRAPATAAETGGARQFRAEIRAELVGY